MITPDLCRAARALINLPQSELSKRAGVAEAVVANFEAGRSTPASNELDAISKALEAAGVIIFAAGEMVEGGDGVRLITRSSTLDTNDREMIQYPEFLEGDGGPGSGG